MNPTPANAIVISSPHISANFPSEPLPGVPTPATQPPDQPVHAQPHPLDGSRLPGDSSGKEPKLSVQFKGVTVKIYMTRSGGRTMYQVPTYPGGKQRKLHTFSCNKRAVKFATQVANGKAMGIELNVRLPADVAQAAMLITTKLRPLLASQKVPLLPSVEDFISAKQLVPGEPLTPIVAAHCAQPWREKCRTRFGAAVAEFLEDQRRRDCKASTLERLRYPLGKIADELGDPPLADITKAQLSEVIQRRNTGATKRTYHADLRQFFGWLQDNEYLNPAANTAMDGLRAPLVNHPTPAVIGPEVARRALAIAVTNGDVGDALVFAMELFTAIRLVELYRLQFSDLQPKSSMLTVPANVSKTREQRRMPLLPVAFDWLAPFLQRQGLIALRTNAMAKVSQLLRQHGITWEHNWLRHSYCCYRFKDVNDVDIVTEEAGNSPGIYFRHYHRLVTKEEAQHYFHLTPQECGVRDWPERVAEFLANHPELHKRPGRARSKEPSLSPSPPLSTPGAIPTPSTKLR